MLIYNDQKKSTDEQYEELYASFIPEDNFWRRVNKLTDMSFVHHLTINMGSLTKSDVDVVLMFKCLLLKAYYELSDKDVLEKVSTDVTFQYFLGLEPMNTNPIDEKALSIFRHSLVEENCDTLEKLFKEALKIDNLPCKPRQLNRYYYLEHQLKKVITDIKTYIKTINREQYFKIFGDNKARSFDEVIEFAKSLLVYKDDSKYNLPREAKMKIAYLEELLEELSSLKKSKHGTILHGFTIQDVATVFLGNLEKISE